MDFGKDTYCTNELKSARIVSGKTLVVQSLFRRLITPRGTLRGGEEEQDYGIDLTELIGSVSNSDADAAVLAGIIRNELVKDSRVTDVAVEVIRTSEAPTSPSIRYDITIDAELEDDETISFSLSVDEAGAFVLQQEGA